MSSKTCVVACLLVLFQTLTFGFTEYTSLQRMHVEEGTLYFEDGKEVSLWGVNFQTAMSWEFGRFKRAGIFEHFKYEDWIEVTDLSLDEIQLMGCDLIRIHLSPGDFADAQGHLVETPWLKMLDYTMAQCRKRGIYVNLAILNHLGNALGTSFIGRKHGKESKWEWMTAPEKIAATETYIRQLVNRRNTFDDNTRYKDNPAWAVVEFINEPMFPKDKPAREKSPSAVRVYEEWLMDNNLPETSESFSEYKYHSIKAYIDRIVDLLQEEDVEAVPCWNLFWVKGPIHEGWESYDAAADSRIDLVSFSTYPGQSEIQAVNRKPMDLSGRNFLPYLQDAYEKRDWQGWLRDDRFKGKRARIVYEFEGWANQSASIYPAMAKYFRAQGAQMATMWTYSLYGLAEHMGRLRTHNLNIRTTPMKAAGFIVAGEVFRNTPRYQPYGTTNAFSDMGSNHTFSFKDNYSAYFDDRQLLGSGGIEETSIRLPSDPVCIIGYKSTPIVEYDGDGMYFLKRKTSAPEESWELVLLPHAKFVDTDDNLHSRSVKLDTARVERLKLNLPGEAILTRIHAYSRTGLTLLSTIQGNADLTLDLSPGKYFIERTRIPESQYR